MKNERRRWPSFHRGNLSSTIPEYMKSLTVLFSLAAIGSIVCGVKLSRATQHIESENRELFVKARMLPSLESAKSRLQSIEIDTNVLEELRGEKMELMGLRARVAHLRSVSGEALPQLEDNVDALESELETENKTLDLQLRSIVFSRNNNVRQSLAHHLVLEVEQHVQNNNKFPGSLEQFRSRLIAFTEEEWVNKQIVSSDLPPQYARQVDARLEEFELLSPPPDSLSQDKPYIILRERKPRHIGAQWFRYYGAIGFRHKGREYSEVRQLISEDGAFENEERDLLDKLDLQRAVK
jgi:hypothetical protein